MSFFRKFRKLLFSPKAFFADSHFRKNLFPTNDKMFSVLQKERATIKNLSNKISLLEKTNNALLKKNSVLEKRNKSGVNIYIGHDMIPSVTTPEHEIINESMDAEDNNNKKQHEDNLESKYKKILSAYKLIEKDMEAITIYKHGSYFPGVYEWEKKWQKSNGKRVLFFSPVDYSGSFYKWAKAVNENTDYAVRLVTFQAHSFGYQQDLVLPFHNRLQHLEQLSEEADIIHIKDEIGFFEHGKQRNDLPLDFFEKFKKPIVYTMYGGKARRNANDFYYRDHVNSFNAAVCMTPDLCFPWIEKCHFVPHSMDTNEYKDCWSDTKFILAHSPSSTSRKGTDLFLEAYNQIDKSLFQIDLDLIHGVSFEECVERKKKATMFFDQAGWQRSGISGKNLIIGWYGNSALEAMVHGIPTIAHLSDEALNNAERLGVDLRNRCPVINVPMLYGEDAIPRLRYTIENFFTMPHEARLELSQKTRKWTEDFHSFPANAHQLAEIYTDVLTRYWTSVEADIGE